MSFTNYFYDLAHKVFKRGRAGNASDIEKYAGATGPNYDVAMESMFQLREQALLVIATGQALDIHGLDRNLARYPGEDDEMYRLRLLSAYSLYRALGTKAALQAMLTRIGYPQAVIEELYLTDPARWAEFVIKIRLDENAAFTKLNGAIIQRMVRIIKPAHTRLAGLNFWVTLGNSHFYGNRHWMLWHIPTRNGFPSSPWYLNQGVNHINGQFRLNQHKNLKHLPGLLGRRISDGKVHHHYHMGYSLLGKCGVYRQLNGVQAIGGYPLNGQYRLEYVSRDNRRYLDGSRKLGHLYNLQGAILLSGSVRLGHIFDLAGKLDLMARHYLGIQGKQPLTKEHRQLNGGWNLHKTTIHHRLNWLKRHNEIEVERGLIG